MKFLKKLICMLGFRIRALDSLAERQAVFMGVICFVIGFLAYAFVRNADSTEWMIRQTEGLYFFFNLQIIEVLLFLAFVYVPVVILGANALSGDSPGLFIPGRDYRIHLAVLFPLWGGACLIAAPVQWLIPHGLIVEMGDNSIGIYVGTMVRSILSIVYTLWAIKQLNAVSYGRTLGVLALSCLTFPVYYVLTTYWQVCLIFSLILLIWMAFRGIRSRHIAGTKTRDMRRHLQALTENPQDTDALYQMGLIHFHQRHMDAAQDYFARAIKISSGQPEYHYFLGRAYEAKDNWYQAIEQYEITCRLNPDYRLGDIHREVGKGYLHTGNVEKGRELLELFLSRHSSDMEGRYWLAVAFQKLGVVEQMRFHLNVILEQARSQPLSFRQTNREWIYRARNLRRNWERNPVP
jgi:hypothetical protein